jgi:hypothetical protein
VTDEAAESAGPPERGDGTCSHPWLRVVCGECGQPVDVLGPDVTRPPESAEPPPESPVPVAEERTAFLVVARGHPELVEQLRSVMAERENVQVIEDRRRSPRGPLSPEDVASTVRNELRRRVLGGEEGPRAGAAVTDDRAR